MKVILFCITLLACETPAPEDSDHYELHQNLEVAKNIMYFKDTRTNLCFAGESLRRYKATMTNVPCTPEVEKVAHSFTSDK